MALALVRNIETTDTEITDFDTAVATAASDVVRGLRTRGVTAGGVQHNMLAILAVCETVSTEKGGPRTIEQSPVWAQVFGIEVTGDDVSRLAQWVEEFTPIKVRFDPKTAKFVKVKFDNKRVNASKTDPLAPPAWSLDKARMVMFTDYAKETRKNKSAPTLKRGIDAVIREAARMIDTDPSATLESIKAEIEKALVAELSKRIIEERDKESHEAWVETYLSEQEAAARKTA